MTTPPLVEMRNIYKSFGGTHAVEDVSVAVAGGEVLGVVGHNGAGKSTLIKILAGAYRMDSGEIHIRGERVTIVAGRKSLRIAAGSLCEWPGKSAGFRG